MNKLSPRLLCQIYVLLVLLAATILAALPYSLLSLGWLLMILFITRRPPPPRLRTVIAVATVFLLPLVMEPLFNFLSPNASGPLTIAQIITAISILPVIYLLDCDLRQNAQILSTFARGRLKGQNLTSLSKTLLTTTFAMLIVSLILNNTALLLTSILFVFYLLGVLIGVYLTVGRTPLDITTLRKRVIAGTTINIPLHATSKAPVRLYNIIIAADPWVKVTPPRSFTLSKARKEELNLTITPPLSGPAHLQLQVSAMDPWGFIQVNQLIEPIELQVIPRAKYAEWLAMRYLEQTEAGATADSLLLAEARLMPKKGVEYYDSRNYQPGDQLKDIDWKHTLKLSQIITKEYIEAGKPAAIIAVNLSVTDAEAADKLAFNLITTALTLAREAIPTALAVYNHQKVVLTTAVTDPGEIVKQTLALIKDISSVKFTHRFLQLPDISKLRRDIAQLKQATSEPAQRLLGVLNFEYQAIEKAAKNQPVTLALSTVIKHAPARAIIALISQMNNDAEAVLITTEKLARREFTTIPIEIK